MEAVERWRIQTACNPQRIVVDVFLCRHVGMSFEVEGEGMDEVGLEPTERAADIGNKASYSEIKVYE